MKKKTILIAAAAAVLSLGIGAKASADTDMYRMYNPNSGEHFYTATPSERDNLVKVGWNYEGIGWVAPDSGAPVYRLYNPNAGDHFYTLSSFEKDSLVKAGWNSEGIGWYSGGNVPLYRAYNPNAVAGAHNYTTSAYEQRMLKGSGWKDESIAWYGIAVTDPMDVNNGTIVVGDNVAAGELKPGKYKLESADKSRPYVYSPVPGKVYVSRGATDPSYNVHDSLVINFKSGDRLEITGHITLTQYLGD